MNATAAEASLINDAEFLEELERFAREDEASFAPVPAAYDAAVDALDEGMSVDPLAPPYEPFDEPGPPAIEAAAPLPVRHPADVRVPFIAAALVIIVCLMTGAATAALVFHDRVAQLTAPRAASR